ncbi:4Fe-4S dicluster domain-containing protein [Caldanaerobacter subterraneus]|uniref:4Fe-4S binding protein n=1 Tax=Caldanaerobacter subterraneus TaxID=911092 RepID=A0A7Y2PLU9_9THEO|nr:4Fe-4S binding protein [Caldanaerobacter subterraneus]NNG67015.1 4Fe-4S binding protein [Caldanaerobacter subterraneus]
MPDINIFKPGADIKIDDKKCIGCRRCVEVCPEDVYELVKREGETNPNREYKSSARYPERCILCLSCLEICPTNAIYIFDKQ